jgi:hypothetical protein
MKISIEFYRTRNRDGAHAVLGRVTREASDPDDVIDIARALLATLEMPQWPDAVTISDAGGRELFRGRIAHRIEGSLMPSGDPFIPQEGDRRE